MEDLGNSSLKWINTFFFLKNVIFRVGFALENTLCHVTRRLNRLDFAFSWINTSGLPSYRNYYYIIDNDDLMNTYEV